MERNIMDEYYDLLVNQGVYSKIKDVLPNYYYDICNQRIASLDLFCPKCQAHKTFVYLKEETSNSLGSTYICGTYKDNLFTLYYKCPTCKGKIAYIFLYENNNLMKIAQYPSLYDTSRDELKKYKKNNLIDKESFDEIYKADICASESYFVAAYTYMRRVFENLLLSVFKDNMAEIGLSEEDFRRLRSDEKMEKIRNYLAIEDDIYKPLYALLSEGIHLLSEEECSSNYRLLKAIIIEILAEQKAKKERQQKYQEIKKIYSEKKASQKSQLDEKTTAGSNSNDNKQE